MSIEALWSVTFVSTSGALLNAGNGVVVLESGRVLGGDSGFTYIGSYSFNPRTDQLEAEIRIRKYGETGMQSIFGAMTDFNLVLAGKPNEGSRAIRFEGYVKEQPSLKIVIAAQRQAELP